MAFRKKDYIIIFTVSYLLYVCTSLQLSGEILLGSALVSIITAAIFGTLTNLIFRPKSQ